MLQKSFLQCFNIVFEFLFNQEGRFLIVNWDRWDSAFSVFDMEK